MKRFYKWLRAHRTLWLCWTVLFPWAMRVVEWYIVPYEWFFPCRMVWVLVYIVPALIEIHGKMEGWEE